MGFPGFPQIFPSPNWPNDSALLQAAVIPEVVARATHLVC
jgi:hypothetical protein